nr:iron-sulfur cluster assembly protein [Methylosinus sp. Sm6]
MPHGRTKEQVEQLTQNIIAALKTVQDPEIPADIFELGLVYQIDISPEDVVHIEMTLTAPGCPVAGQIVEQVQSSVSLVPGVLAVVVKLVFDPPWDQSRMSDEARMTLDMW